jgi:hypothetical protein
LEPSSAKACGVTNAADANAAAATIALHRIIFLAPKKEFNARSYTAEKSYAAISIYFALFLFQLL